MLRSTKTRAKSASEAAATHTAPIDWRTLYDVADAIFAQKPWEWMFEHQLFAVRFPNHGTTGELGICSVMGRLGEHLAITVYLGGEGLEGYRLLATAKDEDQGQEAFLSQRALLLSFESRDLIDAQDRQIIKELGRKYRGTLSWPRFRSQRPGYPPWHLEADEAVFLLQALQQALEVALRVRQSPDGALIGPEPGQVLCRTSKDGAWHDEWIPLPTPVPAPQEAPPAVDDVRLARLRQRIKVRQHGIWQIDFNLMNSMIHEPGKRPFVPRGLMTIEAESGFILGIDLLAPADRAAQVIKHVLDRLQDAPAPPRQIQVRREELAAWLRPITDALGIPLELRKNLSVLAGAMRRLNASM